MNQRIITVFGGSGFLGRFIVKRLCLCGWKVRVAVRGHEAAQFLKPMGSPGQIIIWQTDVMNEKQVESAIQGAHSVINLVGILYQTGRNTFKDIHCHATENIAKAAQSAGVEMFIHVSALGANIRSESAYARTKAEGEIKARQFFPNLIVFRPSVIFGPEDNFFNMFASISRFLPVLPIYGCKNFPEIKLTKESGFVVNFCGDGGTKFQPVYAGDVAEAIVKCLGKSEFMGGTFELGGPKTYNFKDLINLVLKIINRKRLLIPIPFRIAMIQAFFLQFLPKPILTCDQVRLLNEHNVVQSGSLTFKDLGIEPSVAEIVLPTYLKRFKRNSIGLDSF